MKVKCSTDREPLLEKGTVYTVDSIDSDDRVDSFKTVPGGTYYYLMEFKEPVMYHGRNSRPRFSVYCFTIINEQEEDSGG